MADVPVVRPVQVVRGLERAGFVVSRQSGSHQFLVHRDSGRRTTVAIHNRDMSPPMLRAVLKQAGLSVNEFLTLL
ncbi:MAG: type II toxin-antitoxin system HicA family toxin [Dehalococcoidia bacterium]